MYVPSGESAVEIESYLIYVTLGISTLFKLIGGQMCIRDSLFGMRNVRSTVKKN